MPSSSNDVRLRFRSTLGVRAATVIVVAAMGVIQVPMLRGVRSLLCVVRCNRWGTSVVVVAWACSVV